MAESSSSRSNCIKDMFGTVWQDEALLPSTSEYPNDDSVTNDFSVSPTFLFFSRILSILSAVEIDATSFGVYITFMFCWICPSVKELHREMHCIPMSYHCQEDQSDHQSTHPLQRKV